MSGSNRGLVGTKTARRVVAKKKTHQDVREVRVWGCRGVIVPALTLRARNVIKRGVARFPHRRSGLRASVRVWPRETTYKTSKIPRTQRKRARYITEIWSKSATRHALGKVRFNRTFARAPHVVRPEPPVREVERGTSHDAFRRGDHGRVSRRAHHRASGETHQDPFLKNDDPIVRGRSRVSPRVHERASHSASPHDPRRIAQLRRRETPGGFPSGPPQP